MSFFINKHPALSLLVLSLGISGIFFAPVAAGMVPVEFSQLAAVGPSLAAIILVLITGGSSGLRELLGRVLIWRVGLSWWLFVLFFPVITSVVALSLFNVFGGPVVDYGALPPILSIVPVFVFLTIAAGLGEEFGWRGFALPRIQIRYNALYASCIIGLIWGLWHVPLFLVEGTVQSQWAADAGLIPAVLTYTAYLIASAIQMTWVFNNTKGSVLLAAVMHGAQNAWIGGYIDVYRGEIGGIITFTIVAWIVTGIIILVSGPKHLSRAVERQTLNGI